MSSCLFIVAPPRSREWRSTRRRSPSQPLLGGRRGPSSDRRPELSEVRGVFDVGGRRVAVPARVPGAAIRRRSPRPSAGSGSLRANGTPSGTLDTSRRPETGPETLSKTWENPAGPPRHTMDGVVRSQPDRHKAAYRTSPLPSDSGLPSDRHEGHEDGGMEVAPGLREAQGPCHVDPGRAVHDRPPRQGRITESLRGHQRPRPKISSARPLTEPLALDRMAPSQVGPLGSRAHLHVRCARGSWGAHLEQRRVALSPTAPRRPPPGAERADEGSPRTPRRLPARCRGGGAWRAGHCRIDRPGGPLEDSPCDSERNWFWQRRACSG